MNPGKTISHYEIAEKLGDGGMGVVYKAWDTKLARFVALKFLPAHMAHSADQVTRLKQEARAISALNHPNIATIYDLDESAGQWFLALEYLPGGTLKTALDQIRAAGQQMSLEQGLDYAQQIADGLAHAHLHGVVHRDVKPGNMLFSSSGALKITDFGLAKLSEGADLTQTGSVLGTPASMSPEQAQGQEADARSDIFSAGVVLFEIFTAEMPFKGSTPVAMMHQVVYTEAPPLSQFRSGIPVALDRIVSKALVKNRAERYQTAAELAADLKSLRRELLLGSVTGRSSLETVAVTAVPARRRRSPALVAAACLVSGLVALGTGWVAWPALRNSSTAVLAWLHARALPAEKRLVILPFRNAGGDPKDQAFVDGLREVVINNLTRLERPGGSLLVVVSADENQAREISGAADAAKRLGANLVMTGSVVQEAGKSQVYVNLQDPQDLGILRSEKLDASPASLTSGAERLVRMLELGINDAARQALSSAMSGDPEAVRNYVEGRGHLLRERYDQAGRAFRDAVARDQKFALAWAALAESLRQRYRIEKDPALLNEAEMSAARAVELNGRLAEVHITRSQVYRERANYPEAERELREALRLEPANSVALRVLGVVYAAMKRDKEAEETYAKAIEARPGDIVAQLNQGNFFFARERRPEAERSFLRVVDLAPENFAAHNNLGLVYLQMGRNTDALREAQMAVQIAPNAVSHSNLGAALFRSKRYSEASVEYKQAVDLADKNADYWGNLAEAYHLAPDLRDKAPAAYRKAIELLQPQLRANPDDARLHARLAMYYAAIPDRQMALAQIGDALRLDKASAYVHFRSALVFEQLGDRPRALAALGSALAAGESSAEILGSPFLEQLRKDPQFARLLSSRQ